MKPAGHAEAELASESAIRMHKAEAQKYFTGLDANIREAEVQISKQEQRVKKLAEGGHATENSRETLKRFKNLAETMATHRALAAVFLAGKKTVYGEPR